MFTEGHRREQKTPRKCQRNRSSGAARFCETKHEGRRYLRLMHCHRGKQGLGLGIGRGLLCPVSKRALRALPQDGQTGTGLSDRATVVGCRSPVPRDAIPLARVSLSSLHRARPRRNTAPAKGHVVSTGDGYSKAGLARAEAPHISTCRC